MRSLRSFAVALLLLPASVFAQTGAGQVVGPGGTSVLGNPNPWTPFTQNGGAIEVTTQNPRLGWGGYGSGSLAMSVSGIRRNLSENTFDYPDWAFWYSYAGGALSSNQSYGSLASLSALSFDWFRSYMPFWSDAPGTGPQPINPLDWRYKTPVVRLELREVRGTEVVYSELVWEGYYNQCRLGADQVNCANNWTPVDSWVTQSGMQGDNFWYVNPNATGETGACNQSLSFWSGGVVSANTGGLLNSCFGQVTVDIVGIAVGVGSQWPLPYHAFVDNVQMGFGASQTLGVDANFDFVPVSTVPEPSTYALMATGLLALGYAARRRRNGRTPRAITATE